MTIYETDATNIGPYARRSHRLVFSASVKQEVATPPSDASTDYGLDLELDEEDDKLIEDIFKALTRGGASSSSKAPPVASTINVSKSVQLKENSALKDGDYMDDSAIDDWLALQLNNEEPPVVENTDVPIHPNEDFQVSSMSTVYDFSDDEIDQQVLREYELWLKRKSPALKPEFTRQSDENENIKTEDPSPLQRFRTRKRPLHTRLSVTDLLSNMWCEQQFHYNLLRGFKRETSAMKAGTKLHREVEEEIHTVVPVETKTLEDRFGVRIWNMLQGMDALRHGGVTRELEVWGWVEGVWVVGVVDEIGLEKFVDPTKRHAKESRVEEKLDVLEEARTVREETPEGEMQMELITDPTVPGVNIDGSISSSIDVAVEPPMEVKKRGRPRKPNSPKVNSENVKTPGTPTKRANKQDSLPATPETARKQQSIVNFLTPGSIKQSEYSDAKPAYIVDLKTRTMNSLPKAGSSQSTGTSLQLMLYHRLLDELLDADPAGIIEKLCTLHNLDASTPFSDSFIAQISNLDPFSTSLSLDILLENNSISKLYTLFHKHLKETISRIEPEMAAVYRLQKSGEIIGSQPYTFRPDFLDKHIRTVMSWWKGERSTVGVEIEEAWKCKGCEYNEECAWRQQKVDDAVVARQKRKDELSRMAGGSR